MSVPNLTKESTSPAGWWLITSFNDVSPCPSPCTSISWASLGHQEQRISKTNSRRLETHLLRRPSRFGLRSGEEILGQKGTHLRGPEGVFFCWLLCKRVFSRCWCDSYTDATTCSVVKCFRHQVSRLDTPGLSSSIGKPPGPSCSLELGMRCATVYYQSKWLQALAVCRSWWWDQVPWAAVGLKF